MSQKTIEWMARRWPYAYHVAHSDSLESILSRGLLSTQRLLDVVGVDEITRREILRCHRPEHVEIEDERFGRVTIRDQKPMDDKGLRRCLPSHLSPSDWYELLNGRVFFWLTCKRLSTFLNAAAYRDKEHLVLTVDTRKLVMGEYDRVELSSMNSGATKPMANERDESIFAHISEYPWDYGDRRRARQEIAVELCVRDGVPDIRQYLVGANVMRGDTVLAEVDWE